MAYLANKPPREWARKEILFRLSVFFTTCIICSFLIGKEKIIGYTAKSEFTQSYNHVNFIWTEKLTSSANRFPAPSIPAKVLVNVLDELAAHRKGLYTFQQIISNSYMNITDRKKKHKDERVKVIII